MTTLMHTCVLSPSLTLTHMNTHYGYLFFQYCVPLPHPALKNSDHLDSVKELIKTLHIHTSVEQSLNEDEGRFLQFVPTL